ncbi:MAG TPA: lysylphosphatidylglycerol synthase domain-containing protein [Longimicrobiales bacterium]|nr:lysylphosphatidylglycerol synthase domain-containing protein [Longimicrobiales bacterium]
MTRGRSWWRPVAGAVLVAAAAVFLGLTVARNWHELSAFDWRLRWLQLAASVVALTAVLAWGVVVWKRVLDRFEHPPVGLDVLLRIWFASNLARYIPGKIWQLVGAAELARGAGLSRVVVLSSMMVHVGLSLLSAAAVSAVAMAAWDAVPLPTLPLALLAAGSVFLVHPRVIDAGLRLVPRVFHDDLLRWNGRWTDGLVLLALSVVSWILYGLAFVLFLDAIAPVQAGAILPLTGINALSFLAGYVAFLVPAGLGVREGVMAGLLRPLAPAGVAAVIAMVSRLWTIAAELLGAALVLGLTRAPERGGGSAGGDERPTAGPPGPVTRS